MVKKTLALLAALALLVLVPAALAGPQQATCGHALSQPLLGLGDSLWYTLAPEGDLEQATSWTLTGGATLIPENQPFPITTTPGRSSLLLPDRATATTAPMCATLDYPSMRFFAAAAGSGKAKLTIELLTVDAKGKMTSKGIAKIEPGSSWQPTDVLVFQPLLAKVLQPGQATMIAFRFSTKGAVKIDDAYVDPFKGFR
jgi:hypothetical protein